MYLKKYLNEITSEPMMFVVGMSVLFLSIMGTSVQHVSSLMFSIIFLLSLSAVKDWAALYSSLSKLEKSFLIAFVFYMFAGVLSFYNVEDVDKYIKLFERYFRFLMIVPVYLLIIKKNISVLRYLQLGAIVSGPFLFMVAIFSYIENPNVPSQGYYHHIIFGQLAMLNVGIVLCVMLTKKLNNGIKILLGVSMICGVGAAVLSQARGVWLVFPLYVAVGFYYLIKSNKFNYKILTAFLVFVFLIYAFTPAGDLIKKRSEDAVSEVSQFYVEDQYASSVGARLAMWEIAFDVWKRYPIVGAGPGDFDDEILALQKNGKYIGMEVHNSVHNIYMQALVGTGLIGFIALVLVVLVMPLRIFFYKNGHGDEGRLTGFITITSFVVFGLSESWTLRLSAISIFLVYVVVIAAHIHIVRLQDKC